MLTLEGRVLYESEDSGQALIATIESDPDAEAGMFVRIQSWDPSKKHEEARGLDNKIARVTVEVIDKPVSVSIYDHDTKKLHMLGHFTSIGDAERFIDFHGINNPVALDRGDYSIDAPEEMVNPKKS